MAQIEHLQKIGRRLLVTEYVDTEELVRKVIVAIELLQDKNKALEQQLQVIKEVLDSPARYRPEERLQLIARYLPDNL